MNREELGKMNLEALRVLALEKGIAEARSLGKNDLIERLAPKGVVERAKEAVHHAVEVVEEKAHEIADRVKHHKVDHRPASTDGSDATQAQPAGPNHKAPGNGFGVPSATVHPHVDHGPQEPTHMLDFEELPEIY